MMKKYILISIAICLAVSLVSCGEKLSDDYEYQAIKPELKISNTSMTIDANRQTIKVSITSNSYWSATTNSNWIYLENSKGKGNGGINIIVYANPSVSAGRNGVINATDGINEYIVTVTQDKAIPFISANKNGLDFTYSGGTSYINVESNIDWTALSDANWCTLSFSSSTITVNVLSNNSYSPRTANITFRNNYISNPPIIKVSQSAPKEPSISDLTVSDISKTSAKCKFTFNSSDLSVTRRGICYSSTEKNPTTSNQTIYSSGSSYSGTTSFDFTGLTHNTTYYVRPYVMTSVGTTYGNTTSFTTLKIISPDEGDNPTPNY